MHCQRSARHTNTSVNRNLKSSRRPWLGPTRRGENHTTARPRLIQHLKRFDALAQDLVGALDKFQVGQREKGELPGVLGPMNGDTVEKK
jgi:hypothetical protein